MVTTDNTLPTDQTREAAEAVERLAALDAIGALPADEAQDIRTIMAHAGGRTAAVASAFEAGYGIGLRDGHETGYQDGRDDEGADNA